MKQQNQNKDSNKTCLSKKLFEPKSLQAACWVETLKQTATVIVGTQLVPNDRGFVSGGEIDFRLPTTDADWKYLLKLKPNVDSCLSSPDNWLALQNCWLFFRPPRLHKTPC